MKGDVRRRMKAARTREVAYAEVERDDNGNKPKFVKWLRGKFGMTVEERHGGKPVEPKVGAPWQRIQHRNGATARRATR